ncbi:hypothetical protein ES332_A09G054900v1 [Gossypium tomentosum]|uniref:Uncharacterized protein n=1 Tax=Gossypium tomentosum TaxID=34277 RepID=A0A5D2NYQ9_GOSTO|nr:hypothetical protein ES332_A09G054900v1 [Gossypium tomentosum]
MLTSISNCRYLLSHDPKISPSPLQHFASKSSIRFFDIYKLASKEKMEKERARLANELNRGYFDDISELKQHGGKIALANKILIPGIAARKFPAMDVIYSDGRKSKLPIVFDASGVDASKLVVPEASLDCLSFRANSQAMMAGLWFGKASYSGGKIGSLAFFRMNKFTVLRDLNFVAKNPGVEFFKGTVVV